jgi:TolB-like protein/DNA-binding winged helix-turn-helix (wHTH) protein
VSGDFQLGPWLVRPSINTITNNGTTVRLEPKVMELLVCLAQHSGEPVSKEAIVKTVWADAFVSDDALTRSVSELRRALEDNAREPHFVETIPKRGYRILLPAQPVAPQSMRPPVPSVASRTGINSTAVRIALLTLGATVVAAAIVFGLNIGGFRSRLTGRSAPPTIRTLAVLPLQNLSPDPVQEYFSEGMTDALITDLAQISALKVVSRTTIMRYGRPDKPLPQIARELNVDGIVEGTVQRSGDRVRITAQLIYGATDQHIWAKSYERDVKDLLDLQSTVANEIAIQIKAKVTPEEQARFANPRVINPKALDAYFEARYHINQCQRLPYYKGKTHSIREEASKAVFFLDEAVREDPNYIPPYVAYLDVIYHTDVPLLEYVPKVHAALTKALELDENNVAAHVALAKLMMQFDYNWAGAEKEYKRSIEIDPRSGDAHSEYSDYLENVGRVAEGDKELELAQALDPAHDYLGSDTGERFGWTLEQERQALEERNPNNPFVLGVMGKNYAIAGRFKESVEMYVRCTALYGWNDMAKRMKRANAKGGPRHALEEWMRASEAYQSEHGDMYVVPMAFTYASLGNKDRAFAWLDKAVEQRNWMIIYLKRDAVWDPLRSDPRFDALLRRVGLSR